MASIGSFLRLLKYAPMVLQVVRGMKQQDPSEGKSAADDVRHELDSLRDKQNNRLQEMEEANAQLRQRVRELEGAINLMQVLVWTGLGASGLAIILAVLGVFYPR